MQANAIPPSRAWNSWQSEYPAEMTYLPLGLRLTPCAYASSTNKFTVFPANGGGIRLGPRSIDGAAVKLTLEHAGTRFQWRYDKPDARTIRGAWEVENFGEWGLRFWIMLVLRLPRAGRTKRLAQWTYDPETGVLTASTGRGAVVVRGERLPLLATFHDSLEALQSEFETKGYFYLDSRGTRGTVAVLRYHLEEMPRFRFVASVGDNRKGAALQAARLLSAEPKVAGTARLQTGPSAGALDAVRDVVAWNTVWDEINRRPYTSLSRNWVAQKFGGWGVWLNDVMYHGLMAGLFDAGVARENFDAVWAGATPYGNLPCLLTGRDSWVDRSQPPICSFIVWLLFMRRGDRRILESSYDILLRNHDWWWRTRDGNGDGLVEYGTSPVGSGLYRGTKLAAKDESSMDNSPVHDEARLDPRTWTLDCADVGLNSLLALDGDMLANIAESLGHAGIAKRLRRRADDLKTRIRTRLWDPSRRLFANRLWSGKFVRSIAPTSFFPLLAGAATIAQTRRMVALLHDRKRFGGKWLLPSVTRDDPAFSDNVYWRGRIWPPLNFLVWHGLKRNGLDDEASRLARNSYRLFMAEWAERRCPENFNADTGAAMDQADTDSFYGWGGLMPYIAVSESIDVNPWNGLEFVGGGKDQRVGPLSTSLGDTVLASAGGVTELAANGTVILRTNVAGRFRRLEVGRSQMKIVVPPTKGGWIEFPGRRKESIAAIERNGRPMPVVAARLGLRLRIPASRSPAALALSFASRSTRKKKRGVR